jgi:NitT/TauT family transport system ATP-binding protein
MNTPRPATASPHLELRGVNLSFPQRGGGRLQVFDGIDFSVRRGSFTSVVGPSGCGKSTLLRIADGLLKPQAGDVLRDGEPVTGPTSAMAMVFQEDLLLPWRNVLANVLFPLELAHNVTAQTRDFAMQLLDVVGLSDFTESYPHELSGGMRQRVNLARGLVNDPEILLLDEPFSSLDAQTREVMQEELLRIWSNFNKTVLFVTHQIDEAVYLADRVVVMTQRPAQIREVVEIELGRPRPLSLKRSRELGEYVDHIWDQIIDEARAAART